MTSYQIVAGSALHIRPMSRRMRSAAASIALGGYGFNPREALRRTFVASSYCRTALIEGRPSAMWGVVGTLLGESAYVWLVLSEEIQRMPRAIVREARADLDRIMREYPQISATVLPHDEAAIRFARHLGFRGDDEADDVLTDAKYRIPLGDSYAIQLAYRPEAH